MHELLFDAATTLSFSWPAVLLLRIRSNEDCIVSSILCEHLLGIGRDIDHDGRFTYVCISIMMGDSRMCGTAKRVGGMNEAATDFQQRFSTGVDEHGHPFRCELALHFVVN